LWATVCRAWAGVSAGGSSFIAGWGGSQIRQEASGIANPDDHTGALNRASMAALMIATASSAENRFMHIWRS